jgi:hypothetical protein
VPISGEHVGDSRIVVGMTLPGGEILEKQLNIAVRLNEPPVATTNFVELAPAEPCRSPPICWTASFPAPRRCRSHPAARAG